MTDHQHPSTALTVRTLETSTLGDRSYVVHDGEVAVVIDPQRDIDRVLEILESDGVRLTHVFETHIHNDYVTGGLALVEATGAEYHINAADDVAFQRTPLNDGDVVAASDRLHVRAVHTPGHTFHHLSYVVTDGERPAGVFTGGSLLYGATGRPDLLGEENADTLARHQHASARTLAEQLPDDVVIYPTHGFGSFCSTGSSEVDSSTIGDEKKSNPALTQDEERFVTELLEGLGDWPAYYAHIAPRNTAGPQAPDLSPPVEADATELRRRIEAGEWVVDLRTRTAFAAGHAPGSLNFGLDGALATYLGWLIPWQTPVTLLGETAEEVAEAQRELVRIGIDRPAAHQTGGPEDWTTGEVAQYPTASFDEMLQVRHHRPVVVLDVRRQEEYADAHVDDAVAIPLHDLPQRLDEVPEGELWVHCASGYRASIAASLLAAAGRQVVLVDDDFDATKV